MHIDSVSNGFIITLGKQRIVTNNIQELLFAVSFLAQNGDVEAFKEMQKLWKGELIKTEREVSIIFKKEK